jgi:hypothetical protein
MLESREMKARKRGIKNDIQNSLEMCRERGRNAKSL